MTRIPALTLSVLLLSGAAALFAGGSKEFAGKTVNGKENWDYSYDLGDQKPGTYNLVIEGTDKAGNKTIAGPFNIFIDPESDIPGVSVINPSPGMRVGQNLNIVGTCIDDDGVDHVEIQLDDGEAIRATGTEYWSYYLNGKNILDGFHNLTITGFDIKGVRSKPVRLGFNLDKFKPVNSVSSHENGVLVSGQVKLKGSVVDANGVDRLTVSLDAGKTYREIGFSGSQDNTQVSFDLDIDTRSMKDGPNIIWFRSTDRTRSAGTSAFLLMVDNTKPDIRIFNPLPAMAVHGKTGIAGMIYDVVGVNALSYDLGGTTTSLPLFPGNPFFSTEIDLSAQTGKEAMVVFHAVDRAGNLQELRYPVRIDNEPDLPVVDPQNLKDKDIIGPDFDLNLGIHDDDGVSAALVTIDKSPEQEFPARESTVIPLRQLAPGPHLISIRAKDTNQVAGRPKTISITVKAPPPEISLSSLTVDGSPRFNTSIPGFLNPGDIPFLPGLRILQDGANRLKGTIIAGNRLKSAEYQFGDQKWTAFTPLKDPKNPSGYSFSLDLPKNLHFGLVKLAVRAIDEYDQVRQTGSFIQVINYSRINEEPAVVFMDDRIKEDGSVTLSATHPLEGLFVGSDAQDIRLEPPADTVKAELDGNRIVISHVRDGQSQPTTIVVTSREKHQVRSRVLAFRTDSTPPAITVTAPADGVFVKDSLELGAGVEDQGGVASVAWSLDQGASWNSSETGGNRHNLVQALKLDAVPDGPVLILVKATDASGNESIMPRVVIKDATAPVINLDSPGDSAWGQTAVLGHVSDASRLSSLQYRLGSGVFTDLGGSTPDKRFVFGLDFGAERTEPVELTIRARDIAGNEAVLTRTIQAGSRPEAPVEPVPDAKGKLPDPPKPKASLLSPGAAEGVHGRISAAFQLSDYLPAYPTVRFGAPGQPLRDISAEIANGSFISELDLSGQKGSSAACSFEFETADRKKISLPVTLRLAPDADKPAVRMLWQDAAVGFAAAFAEDDDGIQKMQALLDGKPIEFADDGSVSLLKLPELATGTHGLTVWATDINGVASAKAEARFAARNKGPLLRLDTVSQAGNSRPFATGMSLVLGKEDRISVSANFPNGYKSIDYKLNGQAGTARGSGGGSNGKLDIPLPATIPWGLNSLELVASDASGLSDQRQVFFYRLAAPDPLADDQIGVWLDLARQNPAGWIPVSPEQPLRGSFNGRPIKSLAFDRPEPDLELSFTGNLISITPRKPTLSGTRTLVVTDADGDSYRSEPFLLHFDPDAPVITLDNPAGGSWFQRELPLSGTINEALGLARLEYAVTAPLAGGSASPASPAGGQALVIPESAVFAPLETGPATPEGRRPFAVRFDISAFRDGPIGLTLRATDQAGNVTTANWSFSKDTAAPVLVQLTPPETEKVNGNILTSGKARDGGRLSQVEFSSDHRNWLPVRNSDLFAMDLDFGSFGRLPEKFWWRAIDAAGNVTEFNPSFNVDMESDLPVVTVQTPLENEVIRNDFKISGIAFDDDGIKNLYYRVDYKPPVKAPDPSAPAPFGPGLRPGRPQAGILLTNPRTALADEDRTDLSQFTRIDGKNSFDLGMIMMSVGDNEHTFEVVGEDIYGTVGRIVKRQFRVSTAEPTSQLLQPEPGITVRRTVEVSGTAADNNGVKEAWLSLDNGNSWVKASGSETWNYPLDTTALKDGVHSVIIRTIDNYGTEGLYNSIITTDNTNPQISLDSPRDGDQTSGVLHLSGRLSDNLALASASLLIVPANNPVDERTDALTQELSTRTVLQQDIDLGRLSPGWYTARIEIRDRADNTAWISRDFRIVETKQADRIDILFPVENEPVSGLFSITGTVGTSGAYPEKVELRANGQSMGLFPVSKTGHFNVPVDPSLLPDGPVSLVAVMPNGAASADPDSPAEAITSFPRNFTYQRQGAWLTITSFSSGDYLSQRTFLQGKAGYFLNPLAPEADEAAKRARQQEIDDHQLDSIQISYDHGVSWQGVGGTNEWSYRIETQNFPNGELFMLFRLNLRNGQSIIRHAILVVDRTAPTITVLKPGEEGRFNEKLEIAGTASDNYALESIKVLLRPGDKTSYQIPSFIQGLYLDGHYGGATTWEVGLGLTFFDNNVKLEALLGQAPDETRFGGWALGVKLVANVLYLPFSYFFGPDWEFFSMSLGLGAQFNWLFAHGPGFVLNDTGLVLSCALVQWEFARFTFADWSYFKTISLYTEGQAWFVSSDVQASTMLKLAFGLRINIF